VIHKFKIVIFVVQQNQDGFTVVGFNDVNEVLKVALNFSKRGNTVVVHKFRVVIFGCSAKPGRLYCFCFVDVNVVRIFGLCKRVDK